MRALVLTVENPLDMGSRKVREVRRPLRVRQVQPVQSAFGHYALLNGKPLLRAGWRRRLRDGDTLAFVPVVAGNGGSNPLRMILSLALMAFAPWAAGALGFAQGSLAFSATAAAITIGGQAVINALLPPPSGPSAFSAPQASPTYTLTAQGNAARLEQPIPVQYGRMKRYPDFAEPPYAEFAGNDQYLNLLLCLGHGMFDVEDILIEDTPITAFGEVETEVIEPGGTVTLFPTSVVTAPEVNGIELPGRTLGTFTKAGSVITVTETAHRRIVGQSLQLVLSAGTSTWTVYGAIASVPSADTFTLADTVVTAASGDATIRVVIGGESGFMPAAAGTESTYLAVDMVAPSGLFVSGASALESLTVSFRVDARPVDELGQPTGPWFELGTHDLTGRTPTAVRRTFRYKLATRGRYAVRLWRLTAARNDTSSADDIYIASLRAYLRRPRNYGNVTLLAVRMRATNNLTGQASRRVAVIASRKLPVWNGSSWSAPQATRSIAWAIADAARNTDYGAGLADSQINLPQLLALDALWAGRGDTFNATFDTSGSWWDQTNRIAAAGRAQIFVQGGVLQVVRDGPASVPVQLFSMNNIARGTFTIDMAGVTSETADAIEMAYWDARVWKPNRITCRLPESTAAKPVRSDGFGIDNLGQATREGIYRAAANRFHRRIIRFQTEMEGFIPSPGDLIAVQHDTIGWGQASESLVWDAAQNRMTLATPVIWTANANHFVALRRADGSISGPWAVTRAGADDRLTLPAGLDMTPYTGSEMERTHVLFGVGQAWAGLAKVLRLRARGTRHVEIEAVIYDPAVYSAEDGIVPAAVDYSGLGRSPTRPVVTDLRARIIPGNASRAMFSWTPARGADIYHMDMAEGDDPNEEGLVWTRVADISASGTVATLLYANRTVVRVRGVGLTAGPWAAASLGSLLGLFWNSNPQATFWGPDTSLFWS